MTKKKEHIGRSTIEMVCVLAITIVLSVAGYAIYGVLIDQITSEETVLQMAAVARNTYARYQGSRDYSDLDNKNAIAYHIPSADMIVSHRKLKNLYGGEVTIFAIDDGAGFAIIYDGISNRACSLIGATDWGGRRSGMRYLALSGKAASRSITSSPTVLVNGEYPINRIPLPYEQSSADCSCTFNECSAIAYFQ